MLNLLRHIAQEVNNNANIKDTLNLVVRLISDSVSAPVCSIFIWDKESRRFVLTSNVGFPEDKIGVLSLSGNEGIISLVGKREEPINLSDARSHPAFHQVADLGEDHLHGLLAVPIMHQKKLLGVLVAQRIEKQSFDEAHEAFLVTVSAQLASAIAHAEASGFVSGNELIARHKNARFEGIAGASGVAIGQAVIVGPSSNLEAVPERRAGNVEKEVSKFENALESVRKDIRRAGDKLTTDLRPEEKALFDVYLGMLDDEALGSEVIAEIRADNWAQGALASVIFKYTSHFNRMEDVYLRERAADIRDLGRRILSYLQENNYCRVSFPDKAIVVGEELTPAILAEVPEDKIAAIVSVMGSSNSHIAILARAMGIPTVMGLVDMPYRKMDSQQLVVDGYRGHVYCNLTPDKLQHFEGIVREEAELVKGLEAVKKLPCITKDGQRMKLLVNTGLMTDVVRSLDRGAEGVGLYRTEVPFMMRERFPTENEQTEIYRQQLKAYAPAPVVMRTLDVGGDKPLSYFPIDEENPFLGWRGIRVTLDHPEIFLVQVRAMLKASEGFDNLEIMLPMVSTVSELEEAMHLIYRAVHEVQEEGLDVVMPRMGIMIEVPANIYQIKELASRVDFVSVGSNDLTQYLLAVDRNNPRVAGLYSSFHPAVLIALKEIVTQANAAGAQVSICGELAGDPLGAVLLGAMGYRNLSMNSSSLLKVKAVMREVDLTWARGLLEKILTFDSPLVIRSTLELALQKQGIALSRLGISKHPIHN